jgi:uncharacterized protein (DUF2147 family)
MKKLYILAALLMASTAAHAGNSVSFEINGQKIHIETPRDCDSLSCIKISAPGLSGSGFGIKNTKFAPGRDNDDAALRDDPPASAPQTPVAPVASAPPAPETTAMPPAATPRDNVAPPAPSVTSAPKPAAVATAPVAPANTPLGVWATEENKGSVRIEQCGDNLCGVSAKTGEKILINMKPSEAKWTGRIHDPDSGRTYDSTMMMKGPNTLRVEGCAFGGMFCGGQTWKRVS